MKKLAPLLLLLSLPLRADNERFFALSADYFQALQRCYWASQVNVSARRPLVALVLALDEQSRKLNEARLLLLKHQDEPVAPARKAVQGLLSGVELLSLACEADEGDINAMNDRWELSQRLESRREDRRQALEVMAASVALFKEALYEETGSRKKVDRRLRLSADEAASLWKQMNLLFGKDLAGAGDGESPLLTAVDDLRRSLHVTAPAGENSP